MISAIVAVDNNWGIGFEGQLLEHLPPDMEYFKELTTNHTIMMGKKTWNSLPSHPLPKRANIVITHTGHQDSEMTSFVPMEDAISRIQNWYDDEELFIIGGGSIYKQLLPLCDRVYVTQILKSHENVDAYFPNLDKSKEWEIDTCTELREYNGILYAFLTYERVS